MKRERSITLFRVHIAPSESDGEGEDHDEWFGTKREALARRKELIDENPNLEEHRFGEDFQVDRVEFAPIPKRALLLRVLNGDGMYRSSIVRPPHTRPERVAESDR